MSEGIFDIQPDWCRTPLQPKEIDWSGSRGKEYYDSIAFFDPSELYGRIHTHLSPFERMQPISIRQMFPNEQGICGCGCNDKLTGRRTRWATERCSDWAATIFRIIAGYNQTIYYYLSNYYGRKCVKCDRDEQQIYEEEIKELPNWHNRKTVEVLMVDHILPVKHGGGGCWLSNYQFLCHNCHVEKTNEDFGWNKAKELNKAQMKLELY